MRDVFTRMYRTGKSRAGMTEEEVAGALGITRSTLRSRRQNPGSFSLGEVLKLCALFYWEEGEMVGLVRLYCGE